jgi:hypothetical protein
MIARLAGALRRCDAGEGANDHNEMLNADHQS